MDQDFIAQDFFGLPRTGSSDGNASLLKKALKAFSQVISEDFDDCCQYCIKKSISVWHYYGTYSGDPRIPNVLNELWVLFLIDQDAKTLKPKEASAETQKSGLSLEPLILPSL
jgi:hypothetical protein